MNALRSNDLVELIRESVAAGAVYAGTSAGAAAVSELMIAGSSRKKGLEHVEYGEGLGLIPDVIIDQHFGERRRLTRLMTATRAQQLTGVGIDENTALVWNRDGLMTVEGAGEVTIIDTDQRAVDDGARSLRLTILRSGARWVAD
jgi:cyanophycinase